VAGLAGEEPPSFGKPLWWGEVYHEDLLLRTWSLLRERETVTLPDEIESLVDAVYEEKWPMPDFLLGRLEKALAAKEGETIVLTGQANEAIIGLPDDASWNQPARFVLYDEDEPGVHRTLMAQTRLGDDSIIAIPLRPEDRFRPEVLPDFNLARSWYLRAISISRKGVVKRLQKRGVPGGWNKSSLLRNCFPLMLNAQGRWTENSMVRLDDDLGLVYESKGTE
jgi:CRISPR-associated endonuclease/helicase Cas3